MIAAWLVVFALSATARETTLVESGPDRVSLVELYTSEGCSSCPPADQWFSKLTKNRQLWKSFAPVVFHVDYWDKLGWKDKFALPSATARQRRLARHWGAESVYTPGVAVDGREWQNWRASTTPPSPKDKTGILRIERLPQSKFKVSYQSIAGADKKHFLHLALLAMDQKSAVTAGENSNRELRHDFVVLEWQSQAGSLSAGWFSHAFAMKSPLGPKQALVAWVEADDSPVALQAAGLELSPP